MLDHQGRKIDYLRISVTDRCDLRCIYCMPAQGVAPLCHGDILSYEEIVRLARIFAGLGIRKIRLTGGEPLVRRGLDGLVRSLKDIDGVDSVVLTTNGVLLEKQLPALLDAGLDGVNISLDTVSEELFRKITRRSGVDAVLRSVDAACAAPGLSVKLNCVPTTLNQSGISALAEFAASRGVPLRFIELMPLGQGTEVRGLSEKQVMDILGPMTPREEMYPGDKCRYFTLESGGTVGFISSLSHKFCSGCNRVRLTADGFLKTCLQYDTGADLRALLGESDDILRLAIEKAIENKPLGHHFGIQGGDGDETRKMSQIGG